MRERGFYDRSSLFLAACERAEAEPPRVPTILYGFAEMNALQRRLAAAVCREARSQALVPAQPGAPACAHAASLIEWFERQGFRREETGPRKPRLLSNLAGALFSRDEAQAEPLKRKTPCASWPRRREEAKSGRRAGRCLGPEKIARAMTRYAS